jgi:hypothetical protein
MPALKLTSCMAENGEPFCQNVAAYIQTRLGIKAAYVNDFPWQERERLFDEGNIQILWLCGLPYVHKADLRGSDMELLAVVPADPRYQGRANGAVSRCERHRLRSDPQYGAGSRANYA